jgi:hypothetical protein
MSFDLNVENYTRNELIEMFELPNNFDKNILEMKETRLRDSILNNNEITKDTKIKTMDFLLKAKNVILNIQPNQKNGSLQEKIEDFYNSSYELKSTNLEDKEEHMVQVRQEKPYLSSFPSEFFPGVINPLKKRTIKKNLNIDTKFRENYYTSPSTNFNLSLPVNMNDILQMQLAAIELPTTYYVISKQYNNNFFTITVTDVSSNTTTEVISIPDGNYDQNTIIQIINNQLLLSVTPAINNVVFTINLKDGITGTGQIIVGLKVITDDTIEKLELNFQADRFGNDDRNTPLPLKFGWILGFRNGIYINNLNYVTEGVLDLTGSKYLYLVIDDFNNSVNNSFYSAFNSSILNKNILARISLQANTFNILQQNNLNVVTTPREYFGPVNIQTMNIQLLDEYGRVVDLNNMDFSFCITLTTVYDL